MRAANDCADAARVRVPGDKSVTHRALLLAALATGRSRVRRPLAGEDTQSTARVLR
jgi:3-phosphoshikimate 1-carboxyvinyltransferase